MEHCRHHHQPLIQGQQRMKQRKWKPKWKRQKHRWETQRQKWRTQRHRWQTNYPTSHTNWANTEGTNGQEMSMNSPNPDIRITMEGDMVGATPSDWNDGQEQHRRTRLLDERLLGSLLGWGLPTIVCIGAYDTKLANAGTVSFQPHVPRLLHVMAMNKFISSSFMSVIVMVTCLSSVHTGSKFFFELPLHSSTYLQVSVVDPPWQLTSIYLLAALCFVPLAWCKYLTMINFTRFSPPLPLSLQKSQYSACHNDWIQMTQLWMAVMSHWLLCDPL